MRSALYPERAEADESQADRMLAGLLAGCAPAFLSGPRRYARRVAAIERLAPEFAALDDDALSREVEPLRLRLRREGLADPVVDRSFALVREISFRRIGLRHYPVQIMAGLAMMDGALAEMQTGEGKTITAALPAATAALLGMPTHVITVNDYLAARDAELLKPVYDFLGLRVGVIQHEDTAEQRRAAYGCDITYVVNKEVAFDYLRDRLTSGRRQSRSAATLAGLSESGGLRARLLLRGLCFALIDEADSILVDEAGTPLIISGTQDATADDVYQLALTMADQLEAGRDFEIASHQGRSIRLTSAGSERLAIEMEGLPGVWQARRGREELIRHALAARHLYIRDKDYVVRDDKVHIIDEQTGRIAEGRSWQHGLHQMIEVKEGCTVSQQRETRASITYQTFFRRYLHLSGMSGTLAEVARELRVVYGLRTIRIPPHRANRRIDLGLRIRASKEQKWRNVVEATKQQIAEGRPVLIGTRSVEASQEISRFLSAADVGHVVLNAHHDKEEAAIVAKAGEECRVTVATNMAGRGTDIRLGPQIADRGGLHVILTELHDSRRIDRQLIGRGGRQGDPSSYMTIISLKDDLFATYAPKRARLVARALESGVAGHLVALSRLLSRHAQRRADRVLRQMRRNTERRQREHEKMLGFASSE